MPFDRALPYNDLPDLPPPGEIETYQVLKKAIHANKALADLRGAAHLLPNQSVLVQTLGLQEAKFSSEIENIVTTNDELYRAFADEHTPIDSQTKEVLSYKDALWHGFNALKTDKRLLSAPLYEELAQIIKGNSDGIRKTSGTKLANPFGEVIYTPPEGEQVIRKKLDNLAHFIYANDKLDPLVKMALIHYQFEAIHPFSDGNGRTGRILNILYLIEKNLLDSPILYLSRYIIQNKSRYYEGLRNITEKHAWEAWILYLLEAVEETSNKTKEQILLIHKCFVLTTETIRKKAPQIYSKDLLELLFRYPYCKIRFLEEAGMGNRQTASKILQELEAVGVLRSIKKGREKYYLNKAFLSLLMG